MKRSLQSISILAFVMFLNACSHEMFHPQQDISTDVVVLDKAGNNLLISTSQNSYNPGDIHLYSVSNGSRAEMASSYYKVLNDDNGRPVLRFSPLTTSKSSETVTTIIQWRANDEDAIESTIEKTQGAGQCNKVKANGVTQYEKGTSNARRVVEIIK